MRKHRVRAAMIAAALVTLAAPALAGPPWISVEHPSNPHHPSTRGAAFLVRAYHHGGPKNPSGDLLGFDHAGRGHTTL